ncbi:helix-hairpin-helix domain-containing protein [Flavobacterium hauense]
MNKPFRFFFRFTKDQQKGIMALFILIVISQIIYFIVCSYDFTSQKEKSAQEKEWLAHQAEITALKAKKGIRKDTIYPFNPNYISDYKGYILGLSAKQIDLLHAYRDSGKYINSASDFKRVTGIQDTLLDKLTPYFKFGKTFNTDKSTEIFGFKNHTFSEDKKESAVKIIDINTALEEDLVKVYGIGPYYAKAILKRRSALGGFVSMDQMNDFTEFSAEAKAGLKKQFGVINNPDIEKINVNTASLSQLSHFPYFNKDLGRSILTLRSMNGKIRKIDDLLEIPNFPVDKLKIIALYLEF